MIPDKEYLFSSSFLRAGEGVGNVSTRMAQMLEAASAGQLYQIVSELFRVSVPDRKSVV